MAWIVDVELVSFEEAEAPDAYEAVFDVIYPGETWVRSRVLVSRGAVPPPSGVETGMPGSGRGGAVGRARDALLTYLESQVVPVSADLRLTEEGVEVLAVSRIDPR